MRTTNCSWLGQHMYIDARMHHVCMSACVCLCYPDTSVSGNMMVAIADIRFMTAFTSVAACDTSIETLAKYVDWSDRRTEEEDSTVFNIVTWQHNTT